MICLLDYLHNIFSFLSLSHSYDPDLKDKKSDHAVTPSINEDANWNQILPSSKPT